MSRWSCKEYLKGTCANSFCKKWHPPNACSTRPRAVANLWKSSHLHIVRLMNNLVSGPKRLMTKLQLSCWRRMICTKAYGNLLSTVTKSRQTGDTRCQTWYLSWVETRTCWTPIMEYTAIGLCLSRHAAAEVYFTEELRHTEMDPTCEIYEGYCTSYQNSRPKSFARIYLPRGTSSAQPQRSKNWGSVSGGDRVARARCPRRATLFSPSENRYLTATLKPEEREFVVDFGASMHMISKKDLSDAEMDTLTKSCSPTMVITANGEVQTHEEATVCVIELDIFLTMKVIENTPAVLSLGKLCEENGYSYEWING